jgi:nicotinate phosphoribosyltransferase
MGRFELQVLYARAMTKLWEKIERLKRLDGLRIADFGTRRRHSFLWQDWAVQAMQEGLGDAFSGTSNCLIAKNRDLEAIGTNAHELPMVYAALADSDEDLARAPYDVLSATGTRSIPATCASSCPTPTARSGFLENAPDWLTEWTGIRIDSGDPAQGAETAIAWWKSRGEDPAREAGDLLRRPGRRRDRVTAQRSSQGRVRVSFGWGTLLTNDFRGLVEGDALAPFSLVCKAVAANGQADGQAQRQPGEGDGPGGGDRFGISGCSGWASRSGWRWWFK